MSLDYDISKIKASEDDWPVTHHFIWATLAVDLGSLTEKNLNEWIWRLSFLSQFDSNPFNHTPSPETFKLNFGLKTNVPNRTRTQFIKRYVQVLKERANQERYDYLAQRLREDLV